MVSVHTRGSLGLNRAAFDGLDRPDAVDLSWDRDRGLIRLRSTEPGTDTAHDVRPHGNSGGAIISCRGFLRWCDLYPETALRFRAEPLAEGLVADITQGDPAR